MSAEGVHTLGEQTRQLGQEMATLLESVFPEIPDFEVEVLENRSVVHPVDGVVPLFVRGERLAGLDISVSCRLDAEGRYLAVEESRFKLYAILDRTPILRFDYVRDMRTKPHSHIQVHGHRGALSHLLSRAGHPTPHDMSSLHIPTGGSRFRPCLEDVVQFLITECRFDHLDGWQRNVDEGRERDRRKQVSAAVRAVPSEAIRVLTELGYDVIPQRRIRDDSSTALRRW